MKILITGGNGYIAKSIYSALNSQYEITLITRKDLDLTNSQLTREWFENKSFDIVIHCAVEGGSRLKQDSSDTIDKNLLMYYNLLEHRSQYKKFIHFGSGAELYSKETPYGLSKHMIRQSILDKEGFYNLRVFGVFDENELDTRFIKSSIKKYLNNQSIIIHADKYMDFIFMQDFIRILQYYLDGSKLKKSIDCVYSDKYSLLDIANMINRLSNYQVPIIIENETLDSAYVGRYANIGLQYIGLEKGIELTYKNMKEQYNEKNMVCP